MNIEEYGYSDEVIELAEDLAQDQPTDSRHPGVYVIYDGTTGQPLYVGESKNVYQRLYDHHTRLDSGSKTVRELIESDSGLERETEEGKMWEWTTWAWNEVTGGKKRRQQVENLVESYVDPRYPSN